MKTLHFVLRSAGPAGVVMGVLGVASAAFNGGLIAVVHRALASNAVERDLALAFIGLGLGKVVTAYASGRMAETYSQESVTELRRELIAKLLSVPYRRFEQVGSARAYAALTDDVATINASLQATSQAIANGAVLAGGGVYLIYLDLRAFAALLVLGIVSFGVYRSMSDRARALLRQARDEHDRLFAHFADLTEGIKELKQHVGRRRAFLDGPLLETTEAMMELELVGNSRYLLGQAVNGVLVLLSIGAVLFALPVTQGLRSQVVSGYVLTGLYLIGPLSGLLRLLPLYASLEIALRRIEDVGVRLGGSETERSCDPSSRPSFSSVELREATHRYDDLRGFALGPLSLRIVPAEIVFITGGNGCGKSTLAKLLVGLYEPLAGQVVWDGRPVAQDGRDLYRQLFSSVFSEFRVFDHLYGLSPLDLDARANALIAELGLAGVTQVRGGALSAVELSRGQRKRLALLTALLEDRPIYLFDEWAADQDSDFKQVFYLRLLPQLKQRGKAVVVITHDDRYFGVADRLIKLVDGRILG